MTKKPSTSISGGSSRVHKAEIKTAEEKGRKKGTLEIAKNLLDVLDNETIAIKTGLTLEEIEKLR
ncbi:MAG: hypothetical protein PHP54_06220 [Clostridia bacterium]|nr:hypothetical protein [Clostridia bacterium]